MTEEEKAIEAAAKVKASEMLDKYKDAARLAEELADARNENFKLRGTNRELKEKQVPEGATVLTGPDIAKWTAFNELGTPEDVKKRLTDAEGAANELASVKREQSMRQACEAAGIDYADFSTRKGVDDWSYETKDETKDGKTVKVPYVTVKEGDKDVSKPLADHAKATFPTLAAVAAPGVVVHGAAPIGGGNKGDEFEVMRQAAKAREKANGAGSSDWTKELGLPQ